MPIRRELAEIVDLEAGARVVPTGAHLYRQGDVCATCFVVLSGWVSLSMLLDNGSCQILDFALPGAVLGFQSAPGAKIYHSAHCLTIARVYAFSRRKLDAIVDANPRLAVLLCRQFIADQARAHDHITNLGLRSARERIAHLLLELYVRLHHRFPVSPGETICLPLSQGDIGQALGLTYVHVCRTLQILREQKIVHLANRRLEIIDPQSLIAAAGIQYAAADHHQSFEETPSRAPFYSSGRNRIELLPAGWMSAPYDRAPPADLGASSENRGLSRARAA